MQAYLPIRISNEMTTDKLASVRSKLARARRHFQKLDEFSTELRRNNPGYGRQEYNHQLGQYEFHSRDDWNLPEGIEVVLGDFFHNARSALEHLACALARRPTRDTGFPIFENPTKFACFAGKQMTSMKPSAKSLIKRFQPYERPDGLYSLWWLHELNNVDKHRSLLLVTLNVAGAAGTGGFDSNVPVNFPNKPLKRDEIFMIAKAPFEPDRQYNYLPIGQIGIADAPVHNRLALHVCGLILQHIEDKLLPAFGPGDFP